MPRYFTRDHEWIAAEGGIATVGITDYAQAQLGDILFVELPPPGTLLDRGKEAAVVESIKAASDVFSPLTGLVIEANVALEKAPSLVNVSPEADGWFFRLAIADEGELNGLFDEATYRARARLL